MLFRLFSRQIKPDEVVVFYPTYATWNDDAQAWKVAFHASVHEPRHPGFRRTALMSIMRRALRISAADARTELFQQRSQLFLVDHERGKEIEIRCGSLAIPLGRTAPNGHVVNSALLSGEQLTGCIPAPLTPDGPAIRWQHFTAILQEQDSRQFQGCWQSIPPRGISVISDIDDTIKISQVTDRRQLLANTFLHPFQAVPGMAEVYARWAARDVAFHYVSSSPWQLYPVLEEFRSERGFPQGSWHLRFFRLSDRSGWSFLRSPTKYKQELITAILRDFPQRRFLLVGDSSEQDPEIYGAVARKFPEQVEKIWIRNSPTAPRQAIPPVDPAMRFAAAFHGLPSEQWKIFHEAGELPKDLCAPAATVG
ncbi:MAG: App1 family protein [Pirellulales bacterium]|nr:App1 family protein [Pirellulales bacterium]